MTILEYLNNLNIQLSLDSKKARLLSEYLEFLLKANEKISLTHIKNKKEWFIGHFEDSIRAYNLFKNFSPSLFVDCGSGNGLPGLVFAILSEKKFILCDIDQRKAEFLKSCIHKLKLDGEVFSDSLSKINVEDKRPAFLYRGLGPDKILIKNYLAYPEALHFRFISAQQKPLFPASKVARYKLSDGSERFIEISEKKSST